jgi:hypothetical protein
MRPTARSTSDLEPIGETVFYLRPAGTGPRAMLVAADAATGRDRWVSPAAVFDQQPGACLDGAMKPLLDLADARARREHAAAAIRSPAMLGAHGSGPPGSLVEY